MRKVLAVVCVAAMVIAGATIIGSGKAVAGDDYDVVVIGAGGGGLAAAARLSLGGMKVLLIEQHVKVGGYMTDFERGGYTFEVSLHAMDGLDPEDGANVGSFKTLDIWDKVKPIKLDPMYHAEYPDFSMTVPADVGEYKRLLIDTFPRERDGIEKLFKTMGEMNEAMVVLMGLASGDDKGAAFAGVLKNTGNIFTLMRYWNKNLASLLDKHIKDEKLKAVFTQLAGFAGGSPGDLPAVFFGVMWNSYHRGGYYYFEGGSQSVSDALAEVIEENGGEIKLMTRVTKILLDDGKAAGVVTEDGDEYRSKYVVSNANAPATLFDMVGEEHLPPDYVKKVKDMEVGLSCFQVYMGVDKDYSEYFPDGAHELIVNTSYDQEANFRMYREGDPENCSFAIVNYSMVDPPVAPPGKNVIAITAILPYDWKDGWKEDRSYGAYTKLKNETGMIFVRRAEEYLPGLSGHIEVYEVGSPRTMEHFTLNPGGTIFGWDNTMDQSLLKRLPQKTPIENLYLAGAWTFPGGGQSAVLVSGIMAAESILKKEK